MTTQEVLIQFKETVEELKEDLKVNALKYNISYIEGYTDAVNEFEEVVTILEDEENYLPTNKGEIN